jgi:hypothetical protein
MIRQFSINNLVPKPAGRYNKYPTYEVELVYEGSSHRGYASQGQWNKDWAIGKIVSADIEEKKSQAGNEYWALKCPPELKAKAMGIDPMAMQNMMNDIQQIKTMVKQLIKNSGGKEDGVTVDDVQW